MVRHLILLAGLAAFAGSASAQLPSNSSLKGVYNVRYLGVFIAFNSATNNSFDTPSSFQGTMTFDGQGGFTVSGQGVDRRAGGALKFGTTGTYTVWSNGMVKLTNVFDPSQATSGTILYGGLSNNGIIISSSTEDLYADLFVAIPAATTASAGTLSGTYTVASMDFLNGDITAARDTFFTVTADGKGGLGNPVVAGTSLGLAGKATTQTSTGATYTVTANGSGQLTFPAPSGVAVGSVLLSGTKTLYVSPDGNFFIAGNPAGYDFVVGLKSAAASTQMNGLYYLAGLQNFNPGDGNDGMYGIFGSANELGGSTNVEIAHQRNNWEFASLPFDITYSDVFQFPANGSIVLDDTQAYYPASYAIGSNGDLVLSAGLSYNYWILLYAKAPTMTAPAGSTVFLNPQGIVNAANSTPITTQYAPGEYISLYGSGLGPATPVAASAPFPNNTGGTQVMINGKPAPVYYSSPGQVIAVIPADAPSDGSALSFQVLNNGAQSNVVNLYSGATSPGVFTNPAGGGIAPGAVVRPNGTVVTSSNPTKVGETVSLYLTGLGPTNPSVAAGVAASSTTLTPLVQPVVIYIDGVQATVQFAGLAPGFANLYQVNVTIPTGVSKGEVIISILTTANGQDLDAENDEASTFIQ